MDREATNKKRLMENKTSQNMEVDFETWLEETSDIRARLMAYGKTGKPLGIEAQSLDVLTAIEMTDEAARLVLDAEAHLTHQRELAMWAARKEHPELTSREREIVEKSAVRKVQLMVGGCEVTHKSCLSRYFNYRVQ